MKSLLTLVGLLEFGLVSKVRHCKLDLAVV
jgi:hypothetical protein